MKFAARRSLLALWLGLLAPAWSAPESTELPRYEKVSGVSGNLSSVGSDTLANMMTRWAEGFRNHYPNINPQIQAAGSSTAPPALTEGTSQLGPMSRKMKPNEVEAFEKRYGYKPTAVRVAIDALAVFVHKDNPIEGLTLQQVDGIFSANQNCGGEPVLRWGDLGLSGGWQQRDLQLYGRNSVSGTYGYFKKRALCNGDFKAKVNEQPGSASVVQSISTSLNAVGYSGIGYLTAGVRAVPLSKRGRDFIEATAANAATGNYPLSRYLYVYVNKHPNQPLDPLVAEFLRYVLSEQGQAIVARDGYVSLPRTVIARDLAALGIPL
ncbi:PstS family phosphate ABC transporter substrate-binding protein [Ferrimonas marina]|uniref:Phosphate-binding protein n=1 Tax=Ferrimonas marina TaxID=299255 RepID=A0A1M5SAB5_9GAMM|nr:PstS family phosphate ABC transporter substrate-binding protein [Ferrimonas marina]SHH35429.1 phosphate ABC transporter substrate-binding protein, PhoT family [Ferrimonas marina]